jgi:hypothetical protein
MRVPRVTLFGFSLVILVLCGQGSLWAAPDACALVSEADVANIIGNDAPISARRPTTDQNGVKVSSCVYQQAGGAGNTANISVTTLESGAAAQARLKEYGEAIVKAGGKTEPDTVAGRPATFVISKGGTGQMFVVKNNILLGVGVGARVNGKATPLRDLARKLSVAALAGV